MHSEPMKITSLQNPRIKEVVKLDKRAFRDEQDIVVVEGFREVRRALDNGRYPLAHYFCPELFQGENDAPLVERSRAAGADLLECSRDVFLKMAYRDRPEGHVVLFRQAHPKLADLTLPPNPLVVVAQAVEKPGNLGSILRSADAAGVCAVIVCDRCTDIHNPNVVRSSIGTLFSLPVVEATTDEAMAWLKERNIRVLAATPHATEEYTDVDMTGGTAVVVGTEKFGLTDRWMAEADLKVRIPMLGQIDSLNVAAAATLLLYEAVRQRRLAQRTGHK
jgi:RNA methyltransferase, TrmH family